MIVSPIDSNRYSIHSVAGRELLKQYIKNYSNGGSLKDFIENRSLNSNTDEWTAPIPPLRTGEMPHTSIRNRNPNLGFNREYISRPPLPPNIESRMLRESRNHLKKFNTKRRKTRRTTLPPLPPLERSKRKRSHKGSYEELPDHICIPKKRLKIKTQPKIQTQPIKQRESIPSKIIEYFKTIFGKPSSENSESSESSEDSDDLIRKHLEGHDITEQPWEF